MRRLAILLLCATAGGLPVRAAMPGSGPETRGPVPPLSASGRWLADALGRMVLLHGFNDVAKSPPFHPAAFGFGDDDAAFLAAEGFSGFRLGIDFGALMPAPGVIDDASRRVPGARARRVGRFAALCAAARAAQQAARSGRVRPRDAVPRGQRTRVPRTAPQFLTVTVTCRSFCTQVMNSFVPSDG